MMIILIATTQGEWIQLSPDDAELANFCWTRGRGGYAMRRFNSVHVISMHRVVMERMLGKRLVKGDVVDHINGNRLDNRRCNLRLVTPQQNTFNTRSHKNTSSIYKGVYQKGRKWAAKINFQGGYYYLGAFVTEIEAAKAYNEAALKHFGQYAKLNDVS